MAMAMGSISRSAGSLTVVVLAWTTLLCFVIIAGVAARGAPVGTPSPATPTAIGPQLKTDLGYNHHLRADQEGETHFTNCGFNWTIDSSLPQYVRSDFGGGVALTELKVVKVMKL